MTIPGSLNRAFFVALGAIAVAGGANAASEENATQGPLVSEEIVKCLSEHGIEIIAEEGDAVSLRMINTADIPSRQENESVAMDAGGKLLPTASGEAFAPAPGTRPNWLACLSETASRG